jgi:hypothetical protein
MGGFGPFSSDSTSKTKEFNFGNITASEGGIALGIGTLKNAALPGGTFYKVGGHGQINLTVNQTGGGAGSGAGTVLANAIEGQAAHAVSEGLPEVPPATVDKKTAIVGLVVAALFLGLVWLVSRKR